MRPENIKLSAFGPYAGAIDLNMNELGERGLYLITGDTGAGKTTIFDAICFALFGEASGGSREANMLRSKYADDDTPTFVEMSFTHGGKEYFIKRNPEYMRPAKRGEGLKKELPNAELHMPDGKVITKVKDVNSAVTDLLGIDRGQFSQIAMLAQGDFLKLLLADTKERQEIFRKLFKTECYQTLQNQLEAERKKSYVACEDARKSVKQYISGIVCRSDDQLVLEADKARAGEMVIDDVMELIEKLLSGDLSRKDAARQQIEGLDKALSEVNENIGKAKQLEKAVADLEKARAELEKELPREEGFKKAYEDAEKELPKKDDYSRQKAQIEAELPRYREYEEVLLATGKLEKDIVALEKSIEASIKAQEEKVSEIEELKRELSGYQDVGANKEHLLSEKKGLEDRKDKLDALNKKATALQRDEKALEKARNEYKEIDHIYQEKNGLYEHIFKLYRDGQAGVLSATLVEGEPCPVCGSRNHPSPASLSMEVPTDAELKKAKKDADMAREEVAESSRKCSELGSSFDVNLEHARREYEELVGNIITSAGAGSDAAACGTAADSGIGKNAAGGGIGKSYDGEGQLFSGIDYRNDMKGPEPLNLEEMKESSEKLAKSLSEKISEVAGLIKAEDQRIARKNQLEKIVPETESRLDKLKELASSQKETLAADKSRLEADKKQCESLKAGFSFENRAKAEEKIGELGFKVTAIQSSFDKADKELKSHAQKISLLKGQIKGLEESLEDAKAPDMEVLLTKKSELEGERALQTDAYTSANARIESNEAVRAGIEKKQKELSQAEKRLSWMNSLADTASGKLSGKEKIMLETYIQTTYFDRIIARANLRFMKMSDAQYELKRLEEATNNKGQSGLDLGVIDHYNGTRRSVKTLSGGESFMAALSLALGLSDEIQSSAGGIQIDTMFVDEGFGTLDSDSLELAYNALAGLTEGNRLVGIISHVTELKEKIDKQIVVTKEKSGGSRAVIVV